MSVNAKEANNLFRRWAKDVLVLTEEEMRKEELEYLLDPVNYKRDQYTHCKNSEGTFFYWSDGRWKNYVF